VRPHSPKAASKNTQDKLKIGIGKYKGKFKYSFTAVKCRCGPQKSFNLLLLYCIALTARINVE